jgi:hypothetical protein
MIRVIVGLLMATATRGIPVPSCEVMLPLWSPCEGRGTCCAEGLVCTHVTNEQFTCQLPAILRRINGIVYSGHAVGHLKPDGIPYDY